jgi:transposase InsO family protein
VYLIVKESSFITNNDYSLYKSTILDSGTTIDIFTDLSRFQNFRKAPRNHVIRCGNHFARILGYGTVDLDIVTERNSKGILRIRNAAYCPDFMTNLVSLTKLIKRGIHWDTENRRLYRSIDRSIVCQLRLIDGQHVLNHKPVERCYEAYAVNRLPRPKRRITNRDPRPVKRGDGELWHRRMGHAGPMAVHKLGENCLGVKLIGPKIVQCQPCSQAKIKRQEARRTPLRDRSTPGLEIHIDWSDVEESYDGFERTMFCTDAASGMVSPYFMRSKGQEKENFAALKDYIEYVEIRHHMKVKIVHSDNELFTKRIRNWLRKKKIDCEPSAPRTQQQNGMAERSGGVIMTQSRTMRIDANLPHDLWKEIVNAAAYLHNRTPRESLGWRTPYEVFYSHAAKMTAKMTGTKEPIEEVIKKPQLSHLRAYGCRAYAMTADAQLKKNRLRKLDPRAHIGYLVGYDSTNIFRIWIPHQGKVISTRDVIFDENTFFDGKVESDGQLLATVDDLIARIQLDPSQIKNEEILLETDDEVLSLRSSCDSEGSDDDGDIEMFTEKEDDELFTAVQEGLITPPPSVIEDSAFATYVPFQRVNIDDVSNHKNDDTGGTGQNDYHHGYEDWEDRFESFQRVRVGSAFHGTFESCRRQRKIHKRYLPPPPKTVKELENHPFRKEFEAAQSDHLRSHDKMKSWLEVDKTQAKGHQVLGCMWIFVYKTDKHGFLQKVKARLVVWGHQQAHNGLPTSATTLASTTFRTLMAITAKFDLETQQMDAINAFVHCDLDETVFMKMPPGFEQQGKVLHLKKALYGLRRSPILWQKKLTGVFRSLGFREIPQEPCVMLKGGVIVFFYVDDIVFCYRKRDTPIVEAIKKALTEKIELNFLGELKWFLGVHVLRDRQSKRLWLSQKAYIDKLATKFNIDVTEKFPTTPMTEAELLPSTTNAPKSEAVQYQRKTGSILFAAVITRPDIAFAISRLSRYNTNPNESHHNAADRVLRYLYNTRGYCIQYGSTNTMTARIYDGDLICASDASFADNTPDRKTSQGYIMTLFGGPIAWRANKQDTVTTSSTEAELLAMSQTAKEAIFLSRILKALTLRLDDPLTIYCDNKQTLRLVTEETAKLVTKLRHVDIHNHWLRQEVKNKRVATHWVPTKDMMADGLTKSLGHQKHVHFVAMIGLANEMERIEREQRMEELKESIQKARIQDDEQQLILSRGPTTRILKELGL